MIPFPPAVSIGDATFDGKPAIRLANDSCELLISPHLGRVVDFHLKNAPNVLWTAPKAEFEAKGYRNIGGDKVWYAPQTIWNWPPDAAWDGSGLKATKIPGGVRLESGTGKILPLRLVREIRLDPFAPKVSFVNRMTNAGAAPLKVALWQVTQVDRPTGIRLTTLATGAQPKGYAILAGGALDPRAATFTGSALEIRLHPTTPFKYGAKGGDGTLSASLPSRAELVTFSPISRRATYSDSDSPKQVYTAPETTGYAELEHLAPLETLEPRQAQVQNVTWTLKENR